MQRSRADKILVFLTVILMSGGVLLFAGCDQGKQSVPISLPRYHAYGIVTKPNSEPRGYGMYTYVLFGRRVGKHAPPLTNDLRERYASLLRAIESSTESAVHVLADKEETNIFCVPGKSTDPDHRLEMDNYHSDLAFEYLRIVKKKLSQHTGLFEKLSNNEGLFLISGLTRMISREGESPLLVADLSGCHPSAMNELVAAYKQHVIKEGAPRTAQLFESLRVEVLSVAQYIDDRFKRGKDLAKDWIQIFTPKEAVAAPGGSM